MIVVSDISWMFCRLVLPLEQPADVLCGIVSSFLEEEANTRQVRDVAWLLFWRTSTSLFSKVCEICKSQSMMHRSTCPFTFWYSAERGPPARQIQTVPVPLPLGWEQRLGVRAHRGQEAVPCRGTSIGLKKKSESVAIHVTVYGTVVTQASTCSQLSSMLLFDRSTFFVHIVLQFFTLCKPKIQMTDWIYPPTPIKGVIPSIYLAVLRHGITIKETLQVNY